MDWLKKLACVQTFTVLVKDGYFLGKEAVEGVGGPGSVGYQSDFPPIFSLIIPCYLNCMCSTRKHIRNFT